MEKLPVTWWDRQKVIIAVCGWADWIWFTLCLDKVVDEWNLVRYRRETHDELNRMSYNFSRVLDFATGGKMSKTNYTYETMRAVIDEHIQNEIQDAFEAAEREGEIRPVPQETYR